MLDDGKAVKQIFPGDNVGYLWCSVCATQTEHVFGYWKGGYLTCMTCHPAAQEEILKTEAAKNG